MLSNVMDLDLKALHDITIYVQIEIPNDDD